MSERFVFGIPLIARAAARDWDRVEHLLALTLRSLTAQTDPDFHCILAAHDTPRGWPDDARFTIVRADWKPAPPTAANDDGGRKKWLIKQAVRDQGGGLLMFLDADDWIARDLVAIARGAIRPEHVGGLVGDGYALDFASRRIARFPLPGAFDGPFHGLCGSSTIARIVAGATAPHQADPHAVLGSHHEWTDRAAAAGLGLVPLATGGVYMIGTGQNHSEADGPFAAWRREVTRHVRTHGVPLTPELAARFGQTLEELAPPAR